MIPTTTKAQATVRANVFRTIRSFFDAQGFLEIDAPTLIRANAVEGYIDPLETQIRGQINDEAQPRFLMTSPEIHMKRLLAHDLSRIYFLGHVFRDKEGSPIHLNEFMMLEWYFADSTLQDLICQCEKLFAQLAKVITGSDLLRRSDGQIIDLSSGFDQITVAHAWEQYAQIDLIACLEKTAQGDANALANEVKRKGEPLREHADFDDAFTHVMVKIIETQIGKTKPCVLKEWPAQTAALAALLPGNPLIAQRFEIYCAGMELANAFAELTDAKEQRQRFQEANEIRINRSVAALPIDECFLKDIEKMPPSCGIAVGIDRLMAIICDQKDLKAIVPFA